MQKKLSLMVTTLLFFGLSALYQAAAGEYQVRQVNPDLVLDNYNYSLDRGEVAWDSNDGNDDEIFYYHNNQIIQVTDNSYPDYSPCLSEGQILWRSHRDGKEELFLFDGTNTIQLTDNTYYEYDFMIHNGMAIWQTNMVSNGAELFLYDGIETIQLTFDKSTYNHNPVIHNGQVVWAEKQGTGSVYSLYLYENGQTTLITDTVYGKPEPRVVNGRIVWASGKARDLLYIRDIYLYENGEISQITSGDLDDFTVNLDETQLVWISQERNTTNDSYFLYKYDFLDKTVVQLSSNLIYDLPGQYFYTHTPPSTDNGLVVWAEYNSAGEGDIYCNDGNSTARITANSTYEYESKSSGGYLTWLQDSVICLAEQGEPVNMIALNAGGPDYSGTDGTLYKNDASYVTGGETGRTADPISGTVDDALYQTERYGLFSYAIPLENGIYEVELKMAEIYWTEQGSRIFDIVLEDIVYQKELDIYGAAGHDTAYTIKELVEVNDGELTIDLTNPSANNSTLSALVVRPAETDTIALNSFGPGYAGTDGLYYYSDNPFVNGGQKGSTTDEIENTRDDTIYQTERWGVFSYTIPVEAFASYEVTVKLAETWFETMGTRDFDIYIEGSPHYEGVRVFEQAGGHDRPLDLVINCGDYNGDGILEIDFVEGMADMPKACGIVVKKIP